MQFDTACHIARIKPRVILESAMPYALMAPARTGNDVAIVPSNVRVPRGSVAVLPLVHRGASIGKWTFVFWHKQRYLPPYAERFIAELASYSRHNYPGLEFFKHVPPPPRPKETGKRIGRSPQ